ncbi:MAG: hypothetical protein LBG44_06440 [Gemmatimonadota bacterium]|jgi:hypothetical protein|nr:hypothetical protein [Gemmatimonadota bacterium]
MNNPHPSPDTRRQALMDEMLRTGVPEIKLALGEVIDRENTHQLPPKYARLLPPTLLRVSLRDDAAEALQPVAADLERELTDSCNRHGSLYDRRYRVELRHAEEPDAPLYTVSAITTTNEPEATRSPENDGAGSTTAPGTAVSAQTGKGIRRTSTPPADWNPDRWILVVENEEGETQEVFRITEPSVTIGRSANDPGARPAIAISNAPHVSRRQLLLVWQPQAGTPGFGVYNLGLNDIHLGGSAIPGARTSQVEIDPEALAEAYTGWTLPGEAIRIGEHGPVLRINEGSEVPSDPDATVFG